MTEKIYNEIFWNSQNQQWARMEQPRSRIWFPEFQAAEPKSEAETFEKTPSTLKIKVIIVKVSFRLFGEDMCELFVFYGLYSQFKVLKLDE